MNTTVRRSAVNTNDMLGLLMRDLDRYPMPNYDEQVELAKRVTAGDEEAKKQMVAANLRLVLHWARRYQDRGVEMVDLVQEGTFGLLRAVEKFDWERGFRRSSAPSSSTVVRFASPSRSENSFSASKRPPPSSTRSSGASPPMTSSPRPPA
jgi:hypothetical protein